MSESAQEQSPPQTGVPHEDEEYATGLGFERMIFFSDAVFAIAITLLVLEIRLPELQKGQSIADAVGGLQSHFRAYIIGFLVLGIYWINHHRMFAWIKRYDGKMLWLNLLFLMVVAFLPFPTSLLQDHGDDPFPVVMYAGTVILAALMFWTMWLYATRDNRLVAAELSPEFIRQYSYRSFMAVIVFLISIPIAISVNPYVAEFFWLTLFLTRPITRLLLRKR